MGGGEVSPMPDLPAVRDHLAQAAQTILAGIEWLDLPSSQRHPFVAAELRVDMQAARAQLDKAEAALNGTEGNHA